MEFTMYLWNISDAGKQQLAVLRHDSYYSQDFKMRLNGIYM